MPMLIPNPQTLPNSIDRAVKNGVDIERVVKDTLNSLAKTELQTFSRTSIDCITKIKKEIEEPNDILQKKTPMLANTHIRDMIKRELLTTDMKNFKRDLQSQSDDLDDSLTNLQWLQEVKINDILEGKPISYTPLSPAPSSCSDDGKENEDKRFAKRSRDMRYSFDSSVDYRTNPHVKPPYSYAALIIMAMKANSVPKMTLSAIYKWITENFVFYKYAEPSWQNSIRHNLSLNKCFAKVPRKKGDPGKGGYWSIVPEFANKLLENSIRKRRASMIDYNGHDMFKRQRLDQFENQLLGSLKQEIKEEPDLNNNSLSNLAESRLQTSFKPTFVPRPSSFFKPSQTTDDARADLAQCQMDHPYGREPKEAIPASEAEHIRAIAENLQLTTQSLADSPGSCTSETLSDSQIFNTFTNFMRNDCSWSSEPSSNNDLLSESMGNVTEELLEARKIFSSAESPYLSKSLGSSFTSQLLSGSPFCLSPPLSGDDDMSPMSEGNDVEGPVEFTSDLDLTVRGTSVILHQPIVADLDKIVKEEPLSPCSIQSEE